MHQSHGQLVAIVFITLKITSSPVALFLLKDRRININLTEVLIRVTSAIVLGYIAIVAVLDLSLSVLVVFFFFWEKSPGLLLLHRSVVACSHLIVVGDGLLF